MYFIISLKGNIDTKQRKSKVDLGGIGSQDEKADEMLLTFSPDALTFSTPRTLKLDHILTKSTIYAHFVII